MEGNWSDAPLLFQACIYLGYCLLHSKPSQNGICKALLRINITVQGYADSSILIKFMSMLNQFGLEELKAVVQEGKKL